MTRSAVLISYPHRLGGSIDAVREALDGPLAGAFDGVHLLPFFAPVDGADGGFDPIDHRVVDERLGDWTTVERLGRTHEVWADLIVNHMSDESPEFLDVLRRGAGSDRAGMFLTFDDVFPAGATEEDLMRIFRPRPGLPFTVRTAGGTPRLFWTTFTEHQIDLAPDHPATWAYLDEVLRTMARHGVRHVRLDAVGYAAKRAGSRCFLIPETQQIIEQLTRAAHGYGLSVLAEVHAHQRHQRSLSRVVDAVYDFALPPLVLHAVRTGRIEPLLGWLRERPANSVTVLDTHDGIGVMDVAEDRLEPGPGGAGLLTPAEIDALVEEIHTVTNGRSRVATGRAANNVDLYQVNTTWYDAVGRDDQRHVLTRLIQLMTPGTPHVYYAGLLALPNDMDLLARTGIGRDVNRPHVSVADLGEALRRPVVRATLAGLRLLRSHPALDGTFAADAGEGEGTLRMRWKHGNYGIELRTDPRQGLFALEISEPGRIVTARSIADLIALDQAGSPFGGGGDDGCDVRRHAML